MPLTEDCGLVEWVPHTTGLRHCIEAIYTAEGLFDRGKTNHSIRNAYEKWTVSLIIQNLDHALL